MPNRRTILRTRRSGSVALVATLRIRSDTPEVGLSGFGVRVTLDTVGAVGDECRNWYVNSNFRDSQMDADSECDSASTRISAVGAIYAGRRTWSLARRRVLSRL